jgi:kynurenine 3-monooxygenase
MRLPLCKAATQQRSINLAISHRGIAALEAVEPALPTQFLQSAIPMRGRMVHNQTGELDSQLYDRDGQVTFRAHHVFLSDHTNLISV